MKTNITEKLSMKLINKKFVQYLFDNDFYVRSVNRPGLCNTAINIRIVQVMRKGNAGVVMKLNV